MRTTDRASTHDVYTVVALGSTQRLTPEGFLLCEAVPIANLSELLYAPGEVPVQPGPDSLIRITRDEGVLMAPQTLASFEGKPITLDHPDEDVNPTNWRYLAVGTLRNVRRGEGEHSDKVIADMLIQDQRAISQVRDGLREVSCGYEAEYEDLGGGRGRQMSITGNHVALVRRGRCGPICSIGDSEMRTRDKSSTRDANHKAWVDKLKGLFYTRDEDGFVEALKGAPEVADIDGDPGDKTHNITINLQGAAPEPGAAEAAAAAATPPADPMTTILQRLDDISGRLTVLESGGVAAAADAAEDVDGDGDVDVDLDGDGDVDEDDILLDDDEKKRTTDKKSTSDKKSTRDSSGLAEDFADVLARAEVLSPGLKLPTFDAAADTTRTTDAMCLVRRRALARVADAHKDAVAPLLSGLDLRKATCDSVRHIFVAASELAKRTNDSQFVVRSQLRDTSNGVPSIADINKKHADFWAKTRKSA